MARSLFWKITLPTAILVLAGMGALGLYLVQTMRAALVDSLEIRLTDEARLVAGFVSPEFSNQTGLDALAKSLGADMGARITLIARDGTVLGDTDENPATMANHGSRPEIAAALAGNTGRVVRYSTTLRKNMMYVAVPVTYENRIIGVARTSLPLTSVEGLVDHIIITIVVAIAIAAAFVILATAALSRNITRSVWQITAAAEQIAAGKLGRQIKISTSDEIGRLGKAFNRMSLSLQDSMSQISEEKNKLQTILFNLTDGVVMVDREGKILLVNPKTENLFGFRERDMIKRPLIEAVKDHEIDTILKRCLAGHSLVADQMETGFPKRFLRTIAVPLGEDKSGGALVLFQDLTELRALQTMRRDLVGNISHELRTPLAGIKVMVETLQSGAIGDRQAAQDFLKRINDEVDRLTQMVSEITELSRIETGQDNFDFQLTDIARIIEEVVSQLTPLAERGQIALHTVPGALPLVPLDKGRIRQALVNIIHNAIKFNRPGGTVTVATAVEDGAAVVNITDTGVGISVEDLPHVFERFYKADKARSKGGSGLGLAIANHTIQAHGGKIKVRSQEGKGSTFSFSLPLVQNLDRKSLPSKITWTNGFGQDIP